MEEFATVAKIRRPQGRRGEVSALLFTDFPEQFQPGLQVTLWKEGEARRGMELESAWPHKGQIVLKFAGVDSINDAEKLAGYEVQTPRESRVPLEGSAVYISDLIGCRVIERGEDLGRIIALEDRTGTPVLTVATADGELLIPFCDEFCTRVDIAAGIVEVELPEGLKELNR